MTHDVMSVLFKHSHSNLRGWQLTSSKLLQTHSIGEWPRLTSAALLGAGIVLHIWWQLQRTHVDCAQSCSLHMCS